MKEFGKRLAYWRKEKGMTQLQVAQLLHVSDSAVSRWESGESYPDISLLVPIADLLGRSLDDLLRDHPNYRDIHKKDVEEWLPFLVSLVGIILYYVLQKVGVNILVCIFVYVLLIKASIIFLNQYTDRKKERSLYLMNSMFHFLVITSCVFTLLMFLQLSSAMGISILGVTDAVANDPFAAPAIGDPLRDSYVIALIVGAIASVLIYHITCPSGKLNKKQHKKSQKDDNLTES